MKKILFILTILLVVFLLVGCGEITYSVTIDDVGGRLYEYRVTLDPNSPDTSRNIELVRTFFEYKKSQNPYAYVVYDEKVPNVVSLCISFESLTEYYQAMGITGDEPNEPSYAEVKGFFKVYEGVLIDFSKEEFAIYALDYLSFVFKDTQNTFNSALRESLKANINNSTLSSYAKESIIRICNDKVNTTSESLKNELSISEAAGELADVTYEIFKDMGYDYSKVIATFEYSHVYKSVKGVNPDKKEVVQSDLGKRTVYSWNIDVLSDNEIRYTQKAPNVWVWELVAVLFGVVVAITTLVIFFVKKKKAVFEANNPNHIAKKNLSKTQNSNNQMNSMNDKNSSMHSSSWFGYSENYIKNNIKNEPKKSKDVEDDIFDGYFDDRNSNSDDNNDNKDE